METTNIVDFVRRDGTTDALTDLLRTGAQQLIATAVEAELADYLAQFTDLRTEAGHAAVHCPTGYCAAMSREGAQRASSGPTISNRHWSCERAHSKGSIQGRQTRDIPLRPGATLCAANQDVGGGLAMALSEGHLERRDGRGSQGSSGP
jgi:hypothetical protein